MEERTNKNSLLCKYLTALRKSVSNVISANPQETVQGKVYYSYFENKESKKSDKLATCSSCTGAGTGYRKSIFSPTSGSPSAIMLLRAKVAMVQIFAFCM